MNLVLAFDKFKGTLTASEACEAAERGLKAVLPNAVCVHCPIADGGDGTVEALAATSTGRMLEAEVENALGSQRVQARFWLSEDGVATLEMASASGLAMLDRDKLDPGKANTFGTGQLMRAALDAGAKRLVIGLGGSATNDGGFGMARAFGYQFLDERGDSLSSPIDLIHLDRILRPLAGKLQVACLILVDVTAPLLGPQGATAVFGPQKGTNTDTSVQLEAGLQRLADVAARDLGVDHRNTPGAGAAGGLGFGLLTFCNGEIVPGFDHICKRIGLDAAAQKADWVITGEGSMDSQTLSGKGPHGVAKLAQSYGKPVAAIAGHVPSEDRGKLVEALPHLFALTDHFTTEEAMAEPARALEQVAQKLGRQLAI